MEELVKGDVIVIDFPFSNLKESKKRPVLVLKVPKEGDIIVNQITGESYESSVEIPLNDKDFKTGRLKRNSFVRIDKISSIEKTLINYKIGSLKIEKFSEIMDKVCSFLKS
jgi:mRNA interferase MazF